MAIGGERALSGEGTAIGSGWWLHHASLAAALWIGLPVLAVVYVYGPASPLLQFLALHGMISLGFVVFVTVWGALFGYYFEARALRRVGAEWVPSWPVWVGLHLLFWPVVAPLYLLRRHRRIGVP